MLLRLLPDQVCTYWDWIKEGIEKSLPPMIGKQMVSSDDKMNNILASILAGQMVCWISYRKHEDNKEITGVLVTTILGDKCSMTNSLLLYALFSPEGKEIGDDGWAEGFVALSKYGKSVGCSTMVGYSNVETVIERAKEFGGTVYKFVTVPLG